MLTNRLEKRSEVAFTKNGLDESRTVEVLIQFCRIGEIDTMGEKYTAELYIESKWCDKEVSAKYDPKADWNPRIYIENAIQLTLEEIKYVVSKIDNGEEKMITEIRHVKGISRRSNIKRKNRYPR
jgi:hypothetical protein